MYLFGRIVGGITRRLSSGRETLARNDPRRARAPTPSTPLAGINEGFIGPQAPPPSNPLSGTNERFIGARALFPSTPLAGINEGAGTYEGFVGGGNINFATQTLEILRKIGLKKDYLIFAETILTHVNSLEEAIVMIELIVEEIQKKTKISNKQIKEIEEKVKIDSEGYFTKLSKYMKDHTISRPNSVTRKVGRFFTGWKSPLSSKSKMPNKSNMYENVNSRRKSTRTRKVKRRRLSKAHDDF
jgi:hypothetical protein